MGSGLRVHGAESTTPNHSRELAGGDLIVAAAAGHK